MQAINRKMLSLDEFTIRQLREFPNATGELSSLLRDIGRAAKRVNVEVNKAGLADILGRADAVNVQGEEVMKLDLFANNQFTAVLRQGISCAGIASEELEEYQSFDDQVNRNSKYVCLFDPLDGSSNIDVNISIGTIFGIYRRITATGTIAAVEDFLQPGIRQVAAGYIVYGSSTMLVYATRRGVNGFTLDPSIGEFCLSHPDIHCPEQGHIYSVNHGLSMQFDQRITGYITRCQKKTKANGGPCTQRYIGSLVADLHRNLLKGGIFIYPQTLHYPAGKLRLLYECNPFAFIYEAAGGAASNGNRRILELQPATLHERTAFFIGSKHMMAELAGCMSGSQLS